MNVESVFIKKLLLYEVISHEEVEIVKYGLDMLKGNLVGIIVTLSIGYLYGYFIHSMVLWLFIFPLRKNAGGFHAEKKINCVLISAMMLIISFELLDFMIWSKRICLFFVLCCSVVIFLLAPIENHNKLLDKIEYAEYKKRTRIILILEVIMFIIALISNCNVLIVVIPINFFIVTVSLFMGLIKLYIIKNVKRMRMENCTNENKKNYAINVNDNNDC